jgi:hypothetical protein
VHGKATPKMEIGVRINGELPSVLIIVLLKRDLPLYSEFDEKAALNCVLRLDLTVLFLPSSDSSCRLTWSVPPWELQCTLLSPDIFDATYAVRGSLTSECRQINASIPNLCTNTKMHAIRALTTIFVASFRLAFFVGRPYSGRLAHPGHYL